MKKYQNVGPGDMILRFDYNKNISAGGTIVSDVALYSGNGRDEWDQEIPVDVQVCGLEYLVLVGDTAVTGVTNIVVNVQSSEDGSTGWTTIQTLTTQTPIDLKPGAVLAAGKLVAAHKPYLRMQYVLTGATVTGTIKSGLYVVPGC